MADVPYQNPYKMRRPEDMPGAAKPAADPNADPAQDDPEQGMGDGMRHHQIDEMPEGGAHSVSTNADGTTEEMDHPSFEDALSAAGGDDTEEDSPDSEPSGGKPPDMGDMSDMAGMYEKAGASKTR
jgi:hypothetical protein